MDAFVDLLSRGSISEALAAVASATRDEVNRSNSLGVAPLHAVVWRNHAGLVRALLQAGADPLLRDAESSWTPLHRALYLGHFRLVPVLLAAAGEQRGLGARDAKGRRPTDLLSATLSATLFEPWARAPFPGIVAHPAVCAWGNGANYQLGTGSTGLQESPTRIDGLPDDVVQVAAAKFHSAALTHDGRVFTWGVGRSGRLGHPEADVHSGYRAVILPREVAALRRVRVAQVAVGKNHSVCCTHDGELYAWGSNAEGQLGLPGEVQAAEPRRVPLAAPRDPAASARARARVVAVAAASAHTAAVTSSGALLTCGANDARQLGYLTPDAPGSPSLRAVEALRDRRVIGTAAARLHTLALTADGEVLSFGHGSPAPHRVPLPRLHPTAARPPRAVLVTAGRAHSSALLAGGLVAMWRSWEPSAPAQLVGGPLAGRTVTHIAAGRTRTAAVTSDGRVFVWEGPCETAGLAAEVDDAVTPGAKAGAGAGAGLTTPPARAGAGAGGDASAQNSGARGARGGRGGTSGRGAGVGVEGVAVEGVDGGARVVRVAVGEKHSLLIQSWAAPVASGPGAALLERSSAGFELPRDAREASGAEGEGRGRRRDSDGSWASLEAGVFEGFNAVESEKAEGEGEGGWYPGHSWDGPLSGVGRGGHGGGAPVWWRRGGARGAGGGDVPAVGE